MTGFMSRDEYEEARAEASLEERALEEAERAERAEDFDPIWEATVHGELDRVDEDYPYNEDEW